MTKKKTFKRVVILMLALICVLTSFTAVGVSAKTKWWDHRLTVAKKGYTSYEFYVSKKTYVYDLISSYPTIYNNARNSNNQVRVRKYNGSTLKTVYGWKSFILQKNCPAPCCVINANFGKGSYVVQYRNIGGGGFSANASLARCN